MSNVLTEILKTRKAKADTITTKSVNDVSSEELSQVKGARDGLQDQIDAVEQKKTIWKISPHRIVPVLQLLLMRRILRPT